LSRFLDEANAPRRWFGGPCPALRGWGFGVFVSARKLENRATTCVGGFLRRAPSWSFFRVFFSSLLCCSFVFPSQIVIILSGLCSGSEKWRVSSSVLVSLLSRGSKTRSSQLGSGRAVSFASRSLSFVVQVKCLPYAHEVKISKILKKKGKRSQKFEE